MYGCGVAAADACNERWCCTEPTVFSGAPICSLDDHRLAAGDATTLDGDCDASVGAVTRSLGIFAALPLPAPTDTVMALADASGAADDAAPPRATGVFNAAIGDAPMLAAGE